MEGVAFRVSLFFIFRTTLPQTVAKPPHIIFIVADDLGKTSFFLFITNLLICETVRLESVE